MGFLTAHAVKDAEALAESVRVGQYAATPNPGVVGPSHCKLTVINATTVGLAAGAAIVSAGNSGAARWQSYVATVDSMDDDATASIDMPSSSRRIRHACIVIPDPVWAGVPDPEPGRLGVPELRLLTTAQRDQLAAPHYQVGTLDIPANATGLGQEMVRDDRALVNPSRLRYPVTLEMTQNENLTNNLFRDWPSESSIQVDVPQWATRALVRCDLLETVHWGNANTDGRMTLMLGGQPAYTTERRYDVIWTGDTARHDHTIVSGFDLGGHMRGERLPLRIRAYRANGAGYLRSDQYTQVIYDIEWQQQLT